LLVVGINDILTAYPAIAVEADGWDPSTVLKGTHTKLSWRCDLGHQWKTTIDHRTQGQGCPYCAFKKVLPGFNDLATWFPDLANEADGWDPTSELRNSHHIRQWKCSEGHVWKAQIKSRCMGRGCSTCTKFGYKKEAPAHLYLLRHTDWGMLQIGISNDIERRLREHSLRGWIVLDVLGPINGDLAQSWEKSILEVLRNEGVQLGKSGTNSKFDGFTEAWPESDHQVATLRELMNLVHDFEGSGT